MKNPRPSKSKIRSFAEIVKEVEQLKDRGEKIVFTNGCFDLIHSGHVKLLEAAKQEGDFLVVGINSDKSVKKIKGELRPFIPENERAQIIAALNFVDAVVLYDEDTPQRLIEAIEPDVLVKGGDWALDKIVGREVVESKGGKVVSFPLVEGQSTTEFAKRALILAAVKKATKKPRIKEIISSIWASIRGSLTLKLFIGVAIMMTLFGALLAVTFFKLNEQTIVWAYEEETVMTIESLSALTSVINISSEDFKSVAQQAFSKLPIFWYAIVDENHKVLVVSDQNAQYKIYWKAVEQALSGSGPLKDHMASPIGYIAIVTAAFEQGETSRRIRTAAQVCLDLGMLAPMIARSRSLARAYLLFNVLTIALLGSFFLARILFKPLERLASSFKRGKVDEEVKLKAGLGGETGIIVGAFSELHDKVSQLSTELESERKKLKRLFEELERTKSETIAKERLAHVGQLASGVAHEIGNPLSSLKGYIEILKGGVPEGEGIADYISRMQRELNRIEATIKGLLEFARAPQPELGPVDIAFAVKEAVELVSVQQEFSSIEIDLHVSPVPRVQGDYNLILQILRNMLSNAAKSGTKKISVKAYEDFFDLATERLPRFFAPKDNVPASKLAQRVVLSSWKVPFGRGQKIVKVDVADEGTGIDSDSLKRVFEPFFSKRTGRKGVGLGLAICQRIAENLEGVIRIESEAGSGTVATLLLKAWEKNDGQADNSGS